MSQLNGASETGNQNSPAGSAAGDTSDAMPVYVARPARASRKEGAAPVKSDTQQQSQQRVEKSANGETEEPGRLSLADLFDESGDVKADPDENDDSAIDSLDKVGKRLGLKPEQVYAIRIPMPDGAEPLTLGELKDKVKDLVNFETRETQFEQHRIKTEGDLLRTQTEIRSLLSMLPPDSIKPEMVEKVRKQHEAKMAQERRLTLQIIPEWEDDETRETDIVGMSEFLQEHGFDEGFLPTVTDHKALRFIRAMYIRDVRIKKALGKVKDVPPKKGIRPSGKAPAAKKFSSTTPRSERVLPDQRARIMDLLNRS